MPRSSPLQSRCGVYRETAWPHTRCLSQTIEKTGLGTPTQLSVTPATDLCVPA